MIWVLWTMEASVSVQPSARTKPADVLRYPGRLRHLEEYVVFSLVHFHQIWQEGAFTVTSVS